MDPKNDFKMKWQADAGAQKQIKKIADALNKDNELIALWTSGLNKIHIVNLIFQISIIIMFLQLFMSNIICLLFSES